MAEILHTSLFSSANLKGYYRFNSGALTTDSGPNGKTLTNNAGVGEGSFIYGGAADQGSSNSTKMFYILDNLGITGDFSFVVRIKLNQEIGSGAWTFVHHYNTTNGRNSRIAYEYNGGTRRLAFRSDKADVAEDVAYHNITLGTSNSYFLAINFTNSSGKVEGFVNAVSIGSATVSGNGATAYTNTFGIGGDRNIATSAIQQTSSSLIDDCAAFNTTLNQTQLDEIYAEILSGSSPIFFGNTAIA